MRQVLRNEGPLGFYRGGWPPFFGSVIYRSVQFSGFEAAYTKLDREPGTGLCRPIPGLGGLEYRTLVSGIVGGSARTLVECPFEYAKVKGQTGQKWHFRDLYLGMRVLFPRTTVLMTYFFCHIEVCRKNTDLMATPFGQFLVTGTAAAVGYFIIWPLEVIKNMQQAEQQGVGNTTLERARYVWRTQGIRGFWRGFIPGGQSVFFRNGAAMIVMQKAQH